MKKIHTYLLFLFFICFWQTTFGQSIKQISQEYQSCITQNIPTTKSSLDCSNASTESYQKLMKLRVEELEKLLEPPTAKLLKDNQEAWKQWMQAEMQFFVVFYTELYDGGTLSRVSVLNEKNKLLKKRILELENKISLFER
ncbi:lysozyme inhibitor LprI family protein [Ascidiimonas sp. W6]|uniref:lysozyme inhibitor LprI family protein n=1 Tax=Ascidiimonas meishanensis TaxID=3128903 RepID=UPI0030EB8F29